ncbi:MAG: flagellar hook-basal body complex protein FliE [Archangium sp.]|nr:flagellar hook-basal body complex protein FliE [Archangium sp.]
MKPLSFRTLETPSAPSDESIGESTEATPAQKADFSDKLGQAIAKVDAMQVDADQHAQRLGAGEGNLHETMLALEKADVAMRVAMKVRNKILDAYNEVMRMPV